MYLKEIQCINKVTLPYLTFHSRESGYRKTETKKQKQKQKQKQNGKSPSGSCASLCHADFLFLLACRAKFIISINITRSVIRSVIRSDPIRDQVRDPIRSNPDFVEAALKLNVSCSSRHHGSLVNMG